MANGGNRRRFPPLNLERQKSLDLDLGKAEPPRSYV